MFAHEVGWFFAFWFLIAGLSLIEVFWPNLSGHADRQRRWPVNLGFGVCNGLIASLVPSLIVLSAIWAATQGIGLLNLFKSPLWFAILVTVAVKSLAQYLFHRCFHAFPIFWRVHRIHHCDNHLDASSALRFHPLEMVASVLFVIPFVLVFGLPASILAAYEVVQMAVGLITHANIRIPETAERRARLFFVTPVLHRFHHSVSAAEANRNYGDVFSIWDRLFGTFHDVPRGIAGPERIGLEDVEPAQAADFLAQLQMPLRPVAK